MATQTQPTAIKIILKSPTKEIGNFEVDRPLKTTIGELKDIVATQHPQKPPRARQRIIFAGKLLGDEEQLDEVCRMRDLSLPQVFHLVINTVSPPTPNVANNANMNQFAHQFMDRGGYPGNYGWRQYNNPFPVQPGFGQPPNPYAHQGFFPQMQGFPPGYQPYPPFSGQPFQPGMPPQAQPQPQQQQHPPQQAPQQVPPPQRGGFNYSLILKLLLLVYFFAQGGSSWKMIVLGLIAVLVYLYQTSRLRITGRLYVIPPRQGGPDNANNQNNPNNPGVNNFPVHNYGIFNELSGFIVPFMYSLFPNWEPADYAAVPQPQQPQPQPQQPQAQQPQAQQPQAQPQPQEQVNNNDNR